MSGKLIVFEGTDGSGKATPAKLLAQRLRDEGVPFQEIDFPRYGKPSAVMVEEYLRGAYGKKPGDVSAYAATLFYAMDRYASYKEDWGNFYEAGGLVLANRYTTSNAVHQASKLPPTEREAYLSWLFDLEYKRLGLPEPTLVLYLDLPTELTEQMMRQRQEETGVSADIHERDETYLRNCRQNARQVARDCGWTVLNCARDGQIRTVEDIHGEVYRKVRKVL